MSICARRRLYGSPKMGVFDRQTARRLLTSVIEVAYPPRCAGCGLRGCWVCAECLAATPLFDEPRCPTCSLPQAGTICDCRELPDRIDRLWVAGPYDGWLRPAIHSFKFAGETARASHFAALMANACARMGPDVALAPVPLHPRRKRQRGYEQTTILAHAIGQLTGQSVFLGLKKTRDTPHQVGLSAAERSLNLLDAFEIAPGMTTPPKVVLIDDVTTTGSTLTECAIALRKNGAWEVSAAAIAHGL